jgi:transposase
LLDILKLTSLRVLAIDEYEHDLHIQAESLFSPLRCALCEHPKLYRHEVKAQLYMDLPIRGKRVGITVSRRRFRCCCCRRTFFEELPDMDEHHFCTRRLVNYVQQQALRRTFVSIADEVGLAEASIRLLFSEFAAPLSPDWTSTPITCLGIDELYLLNQYRCVLTDIKNHQMIDLLRDRSKETVIRYLQSLPKTVQEQIQVVCTDMWPSYHDAVHQVLPHAHLVVDRFHVIKMLHGCLETVRKEVRAALPDKQRRTLMHDRYLLLKRGVDLDEKDRLIVEAWLGNFPRLALAYAQKEAFFQVYEASTLDEAWDRYFAWQDQITPEIFDAYLPLMLATERWGDAIFNFFTYRVTAGYTESLNGLMKLLARQGRGFSFEVIRAKALLTGGLRKCCRPAYGEQWHHADTTSIPATSDVSSNSSILNCATGAKQPQPPHSSLS